jgi:hypothetical protein
MDPGSRPGRRGHLEKRRAHQRHCEERLRRLVRRGRFAKEAIQLLLCGSWIASAFARRATADKSLTLAMTMLDVGAILSTVFVRDRVARMHARWRA